MNKSVLVLGVDGMVGKAVYKYLSLNPKIKVFGTSRKTFDGKAIFKLSTDTFKSDFEKIPLTDFAINCIGALNDKSPDILMSTNEVFPKNLATLLRKKGIKLIHISTDAVFNQNVNAVHEDAIPNPQGNYNEVYAKSKLDGEIFELPHLTIRTSLLGIGKSGLLQSLIDSKEKALKGYTNQKWSGCTSLQFAKLCEDIILNKGIAKNISEVTIIHFVPIGPVTKFEIVTCAKKVFGINKQVIPEKSIPITRFLTSKIIDLKENPRYTNSILDALIELREFYKK